MASIRLLLDEDVRVLLAEVLRERRFDAIQVLEIGRGGLSDLEQFAYAVDQGRALLTHNIRDYVLLDKLYKEKGKTHNGVIVSDQVPFRELLRRTVKCLSRHSAEKVRNRVIWLHDFK